MCLHWPMYPRCRRASLCPPPAKPRACSARSLSAPIRLSSARLCRIDELSRRRCVSFSSWRSSASAPPRTRETRSSLGFCQPQRRWARWPRDGSPSSRQMLLANRCASSRPRTRVRRAPQACKPTCQRWSVMWPLSSLSSTPPRLSAASSRASCPIYEQGPRQLAGRRAACSARPLIFSVVTAPLACSVVTAEVHPRQSPLQHCRLRALSRQQRARAPRHNRHLRESGGW